MQTNPLLLNDSQWQVIQKHLSYQRQSKWEYRWLFEAIVYVCRTGCQWRNLPSTYPPWPTVYWYFRKWAKDGTYDLLLNQLRTQFRQKEGRFRSPSLAIIDSQSVKNSAFATRQVGIDGNKKVKGRKRHIIVDAMGNLLAVKVHPANFHDSQAACWVLNRLGDQLPSLERLVIVVADQAYQGIAEWLEKQWGLLTNIVKKEPTEEKGFRVLPKRWIVERTFAWLDLWRRLSKDFERLTESSEAFIKLASLVRMAKHCN